jgi:hypothetical protein
VHTQLLRWGSLALLLLTAAPAAAWHQEGSEWRDRTAYTLHAGELHLGLRQLAVGVFDALTLGTNPLVWGAGAIFGAAAPNLELKLRDWFDGPVAVSLSAGFMYLDGSKLLEPVARDEHVRAHLFNLSASLATSVAFTAAWSGSLEATYAELAVGGASDGAFVAGAAALSSLRLGALAQWRVSRLVALRMTGQVLLWRKAPDVRVEFQANERTTVDAELRLNDVAPVGAWQLLPTFALSGANVNFLVGIGYGYQWLPVGGLVLSERGLVLDLDFFVRI